MEPFIEELIQVLSNSIKKESAMLIGSKVNNLEIDYWSDTDLVIVLKPGEKINKEIIAHELINLSDIITKEEYETEESLLLRLILLLNNSIERVDLKICTYQNWKEQELPFGSQFKVVYGSQLPATISKEKKVFDYSPFQREMERINKIWFLLFECVKKFMREDNLIGLHLLFEVIREYLVLKMQERDVKYQTNIHKKGCGELLPKTLELDKVRYHNKAEVLDYLESLSSEIDNLFKSRYRAYTSKIEVYKKYLNESKRYIIE